MSELSIMVTITNVLNAERFRRLYEKHGATVSFVSFGRGTATSGILNTFGLEKTEKAIIHTIIANENFPAVRRELERKYYIDVPGMGVAFLVPLAAVGGKKQLRMLVGEQEFLKGEETELKNTEQELIVVIANQGFTEKIMDAARAHKARGGTVIHAKGTGSQGTEKFFGFVLAEEKEMIYIVVPSSNRNAVMHAIMNEAGLTSKAQAVCFSLPVTATAGMRLAADSDEEA